MPNKLKMLAPRSAPATRAESVVVRTLASLADWGRLDRDVVRRAVEKYRIGDVMAAPEDTSTDPDQQPEA